ncbi:MAG: hypothetical protein ACK40G_04560 [Cytophagaceae bacterium]
MIRNCLLVLFFITFFSCRKDADKVTPDPNARLSFSSDTIKFDTLLSSVNSITKRLLVYNRNKQAVKISEIKLETANSAYSINVNGKEGPVVSNIEIRGNDSVYVFIKILIKPSDVNDPYLVTDNILFSTNGNVQKVVLLSYGQDANFYTGKTLACDTVWNNNKPHVIYDHVTVPQGCTLTINMGCRILFAKNSGMIVKGTLIVNGEHENRVIFRDDKISEKNNELPGQWRGLTFTASSTGNKFSWSEIRNADTGISVEERTDNDTLPELYLSNCFIKNMKHHGVDAGGDIIAKNVLVHTCAGNVIRVKGSSTVDIIHTTLANYSYSFFREFPIANFSGLTSASSCRITNSIIWGDFSNELIVGGAFIGKNSIIRTNQNLPGENLLNQNPMFKIPVRSDFRLQDNSPAVDLGIDAGITKDLDNKDRDENPDAGCFEK